MVGELILFIGGGGINPNVAAAAVVSLELVLVLFVGSEFAVLRRSFKAARANGLDSLASLKMALEEVLPRPIASVVLLDVATWYALWQRIRGRRDVGVDAVAIPYGSDLRPFVLVTVGLGVVELVVVHLLVPWPPARWALLVLGVISLLWIFGFLASLRVMPHTIDSRNLRLRFAGFTDIMIPTELIDKAQVRNIAKGHKRTVAVADGVLTIEVAGGSNIAVSLREPFEVQLPAWPWSKPEPPQPVHEVRFVADDPKMAVEALGQRRNVGSQVEPSDPLDSEHDDRPWRA